MARRSETVRLFMTVPGVGRVTALAVAATFDDASRFRRSSSVGAYLGLTPRRYESGEVSYTGRVTKRGDKMARTYLYEAANAVLSRNIGGSRLRDWARAIAQRTGPRKSAQSWRELLVDLKARGLVVAPEVAVGGGALGFWKALDEHFPARVTRDAGCTRFRTFWASSRNPWRPR